MLSQDPIAAALAGLRRMFAESSAIGKLIPVLSSTSSSETLRMARRKHWLKCEPLE
jgi:hypothetical protein